MNARAAASARLLGALASVPTRTLLVAMAAVLSLLLIEGWLLVLRAPWAEYQRLRQAKPAAAVALADSTTTAAQIKQFEQELQKLELHVKAGSTDMPADRLVLMLVDRLSDLARSHAVALGGVRVGTARRVFKFDEVSFDIQASGRYQSLVDLLRDIDQRLQPVAVSQFSIRQVDATGKLDMDVKLVAYRPPHAGESEK